MEDAIRVLKLGLVIAFLCLLAIYTGDRRYRNIETEKLLNEKTLYIEEIRH